LTSGGNKNDTDVMLRPTDPAPAPFDEWNSRWAPGTPEEPAALSAWQLQQAWQVAEELAERNPFYRDRLTLPSGRTAEDFRRLPVTYKQDVVGDCQEFPPYGSRTVRAREQIRHFVETSGTSGKGREVYALDAADEDAIFRAEAVGFWWAGVRPGTTVLMTLPVGVGAAGLWYRGALQLIGANVISAGSYGTETKVDLLRRFEAEVIVGTPSYVEKLAAACVAQGVDPRELPVRAIVVAGEPYGLLWAERVQERWGATLYEQYGCTERIMGWTCPGGVIRDGALAVLHVPAELAYWEVIDPDTGEPAEDGAWGELISTPLHAWASPLLRFATRDRVQYVAAGSCPCGRPLAGIRAGGVQRYDNMMKIRGVNLWPEMFDRVILSVPGVREYRGTVSASATGEVIRVGVEPTEDADGSVAEAVRQAIRSATSVTVEVDLVDPGDIVASTPTGFTKVSRWHDERTTIRSSRDEQR
jgi:phenylacetate-CoA ligase